MSAVAISTHGVMEGGGSYNQHAEVPAGGGNLALPCLEDAARSLAVRPGNDPLVIADYGSSQGKNSLAPMRAAIRCLRTRVGSERPIIVVHVDQHANDFNTLFDVLHADPERYSMEDPSVFPSAIGRSFYEDVFPRGQVDLGWCSYAAVWLSRVPALIPGHFVSLASTGEVRAAFDRQASDDWRLFLSLRARELRPGGRLVVVLPGLSDAGASGFEPLFNCANAVLAQLVHEQVIRDDERKRMVLGAYPDDERNYWSPSARMVNFNLFQSNIATFSTWLTRLGLTTNWTAMYKSLSAATLHSSERSSYPPCLQRSAMPVGVKPSLNAWNEN